MTAVIPTILKGIGELNQERNGCCFPPEKKEIYDSV
jgi:hypothetical protein